MKDNWTGAIRFGNTFYQGANTSFSIITADGFYRFRTLDELTDSDIYQNTEQKSIRFHSGIAHDDTFKNTAQDDERTERVKDNLNEVAKLNKKDKNNHLYLSLLTPGLYKEKTHFEFIKNQKYEGHKIRTLFSPMLVARIPFFLHNWAAANAANAYAQELMNAEYPDKFDNFCLNKLKKEFGFTWRLRNIIRLSAGKMFANPNVFKAIAIAILAIIQLIINIISFCLIPITDIYKLVVKNEFRSPKAVFGQPNSIVFFKKLARLILIIAVTSLVFIPGMPIPPYVLLTISLLSCISLLFKPEAPSNQLADKMQLIKILHPGSVWNSCKTARDRTGIDNMREVLLRRDYVESTGGYVLNKLNAQQLKRLKGIIQNDSKKTYYSKIDTHIRDNPNTLTRAEFTALKQDHPETKKLLKLGDNTIQDSLDEVCDLTGKSMTDIGEDKAFKQWAVLQNTIGYCFLALIPFAFGTGTTALAYLTVNSEPIIPISLVIIALSFMITSGLMLIAKPSKTLKDYETKYNNPKRNALDKYLKKHKNEKPSTYELLSLAKNQLSDPLKDQFTRTRGKNFFYEGGKLQFTAFNGESYSSDNINIKALYNALPAKEPEDHSGELYLVADYIAKNNLNCRASYLQALVTDLKKAYNTPKTKPKPKSKPANHFSTKSNTRKNPTSTSNTPGSHAIIDNLPR